VNKATYDRALNLRITKELWIFLKKQSMEEELSINKIINRCLEKFKKRKEKSIDVGI
jgi:predicted HicB family RNase H-like nuclease